MHHPLLAVLLVADCAWAYPWVVNVAGVDSRLLRRQQSNPNGPGGAATCPFNADHVPAAPITNEYPYNSAADGLPGLGVGGYLVPAPGDTAHAFVAPNYNTDMYGSKLPARCALVDILLAVVLAQDSIRPQTTISWLIDGITTFAELVDAQQNLYNVGYDLAVTLAVLGLTTTDGDIATEKLSIGCDATTRTSISPLLTGSEPGLDGHNHFEADTSLTRNDYFPSGGNNYEFNGTLFGYMAETCNGNFDLDNLALYRYQRYQQSIAENSNFYFGPFSILLYGAASFLYELMPSGTQGYAPNLETISSFFGAESDGNGGWTFNGQEKIPPNWTNRVSPYTNNDVSNQILEMYTLYPVLFGGNTGPGEFDTISSGNIQNGVLTDPSASTILCLIYQLATERIPSSLNGFVTPTVEAVAFAATKLNPVFENLGCPLALT